MNSFECCAEIKHKILLFRSLVRSIAKAFVLILCFQLFFFFHSSITSFASHNCWLLHLCEKRRTKMFAWRWSICAIANQLILFVVWNIFPYVQFVFQCSFFTCKTSWTKFAEMKFGRKIYTFETLWTTSMQLSKKFHIVQLKIDRKLISILIEFIHWLRATNMSWASENKKNKKIINEAMINQKEWILNVFMHTVINLIKPFMIGSLSPLNDIRQFFNRLNFWCEFMIKKKKWPVNKLIRIIAVDRQLFENKREPKTK